MWVLMRTWALLSILHTNTTDTIYTIHYTCTHRWICSCLPDPHTTNTKRASRYGPTGLLSSSAFCGRNTQTTQWMVSHFELSYIDLLRETWGRFLWRSRSGCASCWRFSFSASLRPFSKSVCWLVQPKLVRSCGTAGVFGVTLTGYARHWSARNIQRLAGIVPGKRPMSGKQHRFPLEDKGQIHGAPDTPGYYWHLEGGARATKTEELSGGCVRYTVSEMGEDRFEFHQLPRDVEGEVKTQAREILELFEKWCVCEKTSRCERYCAK